MDERGRPFCFEIVTKMRNYVFAAATSDAMQVSCPARSPRCPFERSVQHWIGCLALKTTLHHENLQIERAEALLCDTMRTLRERFLAQPDDAGADLASTASTATVVATPALDTKKQWALEAIQAGNFEHGKELLLECLTDHHNDAMLLYNLACVESLLRNKRDSFRYLELALKNGYCNVDKLLNDKDLNNVRMLDEFWPMVKQYQASVHVFDLLRQPDTGVPVRSRKWLMRTFPNCFVGSEAVTWLMQHSLADSRANAVAIGRELMERGLIRHVTGAHGFEDENLYYVFIDANDAGGGEEVAPVVDEDDIVLKVL